MKKEIKIQKQKEFLISIAFWSVWILIAFLFLKAAGSILLPFVLAFAVAWLLASPVDFVAKQTRIRRNFISVILVIGFYVLLGIVVYLIGSRLMYLLYDTIAEISAFFVETVIPILQRFFRWLERTIPMAELLPAYEKQSGKETERIGTLFLGMSGGLMDGISSMAAGLPGLFMNMLITVIATVFMELEFHKIFDFLKKQVPEEYQRLLVDGKGYVGRNIRKMFWLLLPDLLDNISGTVPGTVPARHKTGSSACVCDRCTGYPSSAGDRYGTDPLGSDRGCSRECQNGDWDWCTVSDHHDCEKYRRTQTGGTSDGAVPGRYASLYADRVKTFRDYRIISGAAWSGSIKSVQ